MGFNGLIFAIARWLSLGDAFAMEIRRTRLLAVIPTLACCGKVDLGPGGAQSDAAGKDSGSGSAVVLYYDFEEDLAADGSDHFVVDASGNDRRAKVLQTTKSLIERFERDGTGDHAIRFPGPCEGEGCPRAILDVENSSDQNPGERNFAVTVDLRLETAAPMTGSNDENVIQKGNFDSVGQWKMEVDGLRHPACIFHYPGDRLDGATGSPRVKIEERIDDGNWHTVRCERKDEFIQIKLDGGEPRKEDPPGTVDINNELPILVGGQNTSNSSDQFHGSLDNIKIEFFE